MSLKSFECAVLPVKKLCHWTIGSSLRRRRKGKNSMVLTSSCSRSICFQALPVVFLSYFVYGSSVCGECVCPVGP
uniref:Uncharacterized protein n=1 Tax=Oryza rufipogon TaxID=4529 RepID=A0A0E0MZ40_ORYRU